MQMRQHAAAVDLGSRACVKFPLKTFVAGQCDATCVGVSLLRCVYG
jgi:hypothetical protein